MNTDPYAIFGTSKNNTLNNKKNNNKNISPSGLPYCPANVKNCPYKKKSPNNNRSPSRNNNNNNRSPS